MSRQITRDQCTATLDDWVDAEVAVRVVNEDADLIAVMRGQLCARAAEKDPALFWALARSGEASHAEKSGLYLHPDSFDGALLREGNFVLELRQRNVTLNIRKL